MKKVKSIKGWGICQLNEKEVEEYGFKYAVIHPDNAEYLRNGVCDPSDTDVECDSLESAVSWVNNY